MLSSRKRHPRKGRELIRGMAKSSLRIVVLTTHARAREGRTRRLRWLQTECEPDLRGLRPHEREHGSSERPSPQFSQAAAGSQLGMALHPSRYSPTTAELKNGRRKLTDPMEAASFRVSLRICKSSLAAKTPAPKVAPRLNCAIVPITASNIAEQRRNQLPTRPRSARGQTKTSQGRS